MPAVGVHELLTRGPLASWWDDLVRRANPRYSGGTTQGYYVLASDGTPVLWDNYIPRIPEVLRRGLSLAKDRRARGAPPPELDAASAAPPQPPPGTSVVRLFTRIHPLPDGAGPMNALIGRDYMWILEDEVKAIAERATTRGTIVDLPATLASRLCIFHLADNVRGTVWPWSPRSVSRCELEGRVTAVEGAKRRLVITGAIAKEDSHPPQWSARGQVGTIEGELEVDAGAARIVRLRLIAKQTAWSDATYSRAASPPSGRYPLVTAIVEANDPLASQIAPDAATMGAAYLRPPAVGGR